MEALFFYLFGTLAVISALLTITRRDPVTSAFWLIFCFLSVAGLFALLHAHLMAILQILLYAGAIMVFFLFVTMFLGKDSGPSQRPNAPMFLIGLASIVATGLLMTRVVRGSGSAFDALPSSYGGLERVSELLLTRYLFSFELVGLLLTVAVIGAVHLARREAEGSRGARAMPEIVVEAEADGESGEEVHHA